MKKTTMDFIYGELITILDFARIPWEIVVMLRRRRPPVIIAVQKGTTTNKINVAFNVASRRNLKKVSISVARSFS